MKKGIIAFIIFIFIVFLSLADIGLNFIGWIPILGDSVASMGEVLIETIQILLTGIAFWLLTKLK